jgi:hypothetical protein
MNSLNNDIRLLQRACYLKPQKSNMHQYLGNLCFDIIQSQDGTRALLVELLLLSMDIPIPRHLITLET